MLVCVKFSYLTDKRRPDALASFYYTIVCLAHVVDC
jgi:hypothetical protein